MRDQGTANGIEETRVNGQKRTRRSNREVTHRFYTGFSVSFPLLALRRTADSSPARRSRRRLKAFVAYQYYSLHSYLMWPGRRETCLDIMIHIFRALAHVRYRLDTLAIP